MQSSDVTPTEAIWVHTGMNIMLQSQW